MGVEVADLLVKFRREAASGGSRTYAAAIIGLVRERIARDIEAAKTALPETATPTTVAVTAVRNEALDLAALISRGLS